MSKPFLFPLSAANALTPEFLAGHVQIQDLQRILIPASDDPRLREFGELEIDVELLEALLDTFLERAEDFDDVGSMDAWLAPRIHFALRIPKRLAADPRFWTWLTIMTGQKYVQLRWGKAAGEQVTRFRYMDSNLNLRNALSRLWWAAEMTRNGPDYLPVIPVLKKVRTAQFALELAYSSVRAAAIGFAAACNEPPETTDLEKRRLSKAARAYLGTSALEMLALDPTFTPAAEDREWRNHGSTLEQTLRSIEQLDGPRDEYVSEKSIEQMTQWFVKLLAEIRDA